MTSWVDVICIIIVFLSLIILSSYRVAAMIRVFAVQSLALGLLPFFLQASSISSQDVFLALITMIHEVMILDHSGVDLAYMFYAAAIKLFVFAGILVPIIVPIQTGNPVGDMLIFLGGMLGVSIAVGIVESTMARHRLNRVKNLQLIAFALAFFGFVVKMLILFIVLLWREGQLANDGCAL